MANIKTAVAGAMMGTHLRVGQEDNLFEAKGKPFTSNAAQVEKVKRILGEMNIGLMPVAKAREVLKL
jgi:uncharacterized protein (DUF849 family)